MQLPGPWLPAPPAPSRERPWVLLGTGVPLKLPMAMEAGQHDRLPRCNRKCRRPLPQPRTTPTNLLALSHVMACRPSRTASSGYYTVCASFTWTKPRSTFLAKGATSPLRAISGVPGRRHCPAVPGCHRCCPAVLGRRRHHPAVRGRRRCRPAVPPVPLVMPGSCVVPPVLPVGCVVLIVPPGSCVVLIA
jgi:hypothetical protein